MNLWLKPQKRPVQINLDDFRDYEHFHYSFEQYVDLKVPKIVTVRWEPTKNFLVSLEGPEDEENAFIRYVAGRIADGDDVPPILVDQDGVFDGRHRAWAADELGLKKVPVVDISPFWVKEHLPGNPLTDQLLRDFVQSEDDPEERILSVGGIPKAAVVMVDLHAESRGGRAVYFENLYALQRGGGRRAMELILRRADDLGITVYIAPDPELPVKSAGIRMAPARLRKWYAGFGFSPVRGSEEMIRAPW